MKSNEPSSLFSPSPSPAPLSPFLDLIGNTFKEGEGEREGEPLDFHCNLLSRFRLLLSFSSSHSSSTLELQVELQQQVLVVLNNIIHLLLSYSSPPLESLEKALLTVSSFWSLLTKETKPQLLRHSCLLEKLSDTIRHLLTAKWSFLLLQKGPDSALDVRILYRESLSVISLFVSLFLHLQDLSFAFASASASEDRSRAPASSQISREPWWKLVSEESLLSIIKTLIFTLKVNSNFPFCRKDGTTQTPHRLLFQEEVKHLKTGDAIVAILTSSILDLASDPPPGHFFSRDLQLESLILLRLIIHRLSPVNFPIISPDSQPLCKFLPALSSVSVKNICGDRKRGPNVFSYSCSVLEFLFSSVFSRLNFSASVSDSVSAFGLESKDRCDLDHIDLFLQLKSLSQTKEGSVSSSESESSRFPSTEINPDFIKWIEQVSGPKISQLISLLINSLFPLPMDLDRQLSSVKLLIVLMNNCHLPEKSNGELLQSLLLFESSSFPQIHSLCWTFVERCVPLPHLLGFFSSKLEEITAMEHQIISCTESTALLRSLTALHYCLAHFNSPRVLSSDSTLLAIRTRLLSSLSTLLSIFHIIFRTKSSNRSFIRETISISSSESNYLQLSAKPRLSGFTGPFSSENDSEATMNISQPNEEKRKAKVCDFPIFVMDHQIIEEASKVMETIGSCFISFPLLCSDFFSSTQLDAFDLSSPTSISSLLCLWQLTSGLVYQLRSPSPPPSSFVDHLFDLDEEENDLYSAFPGIPFLSSSPEVDLCSSSTRENSKEIVDFLTFLVRDIIFMNSQTVPSVNPESETFVNPPLVQQKRNPAEESSRICFLLLIISECAAGLQDRFDEFLVDCLVQLMERFQSPDHLVAFCAQQTLEEIRKALSYTSHSQLIDVNLQLLVDRITYQMQFLSLYPHTPHLLRSLLDFSADIDDPLVSTPVAFSSSSSSSCILRHRFPDFIFLLSDCVEFLTRRLLLSDLEEGKICMKMLLMIISSIGAFYQPKVELLQSSLSALGSLPTAPKGESENESGANMKEESERSLDGNGDDSQCVVLPFTFQMLLRILSNSIDFVSNSDRQMRFYCVQLISNCLLNLQLCSSFESSLQVRLKMEGQRGSTEIRKLPQPLLATKLKEELSPILYQLWPIVCFQIRSCDWQLLVDLECAITSMLAFPSIVSQAQIESELFPFVSRHFSTILKECCSRHSDPQSSETSLPFRCLRFVSTLSHFHHLLPPPSQN